jgi:hypothetical protein
MTWPHCKGAKEYSSAVCRKKAQKLMSTGIVCSQLFPIILRVESEIFIMTHKAGLGESLG